MDDVTVAIYDERGARWAAEHQTVRPDAVRAVAERARPGVRADLGAGGGRYTALLGEPVVALDASLPMLELIPAVAPSAMRVLGDLEALPFRDRSLAAGWANMSYLHVPRPRLPLALAQLHWAMQPGAPFEIQVLHGDQDYGPIHDDGVGGRLFAAWPEDQLADVVTGAGFEVEGSGVHEDEVRMYGTRMVSLPDVVAPGMRVLVCGLNPSVYAAERGVGFARRTNRFWPCAVEAGLVSRPFAPRHALAGHGVGMTDIVKRATVRSSELGAAEYEAGLARVERLVAWLEPRIVCFVGLEGWRSAFDRAAQPGLQKRTIGGRPVYLMPSTSGLNARTSRAELVAHLTTVRRLGMTSL